MQNRVDCWPLPVPSWGRKGWRKLLVIAAFIAMSPWVPEARAQPAPVPVVGQVTDAETDAPVPLATVSIAHAFRGTATDDEGRYRFATRPGTRLQFRALGYETVYKTVPRSASDTVRIDVALAPDRIPLGTVTVEADAEANPATYRLRPASIRNAPALGEPDVVRAAAFLPGVTQANDFQSQINVRGGAADQNLYLLDGVEVYDPRHLIGVFSAFNPWVLSDVTFHNGVFPAEYAGRLSSVLALETRTPTDSLHANGNISLLSSSVALSDRYGDTGVVVAARRTYLDVISQAVSLDLGYRFHDANAKVSHALTPQWTIEALGFLSTDVARQTESAETESEEARDLETRTRWGNRMGALRLRHETGRFKQRLTASYSGAFDDASYDQDRAFADNTLHDRVVRYDASLVFQAHRLALGAQAREVTNEYAWDAQAGLDLDEIFYDGVPLVFSQTQRQTRYSLYATEDVFLGERVLASIGARYTTLGGWTDGVVAPRVTVSVEATDAVQLNAGAGVHYQFVAEGRQGTEFSIGSPLFLFDAPQRAAMVSTGATMDLGERYRLRTDVYVRRFDDVAEIVPSEPEAFPEFRRRKARAYGLDVLLEKTRGWVTFQGAYTFLRSEAKRDGGYVLADYDVPHTVQGVMGLRIGPEWLFNIAGVYRSGTPYTPVVGMIYGPGNPNRRSPADGYQRIYRRYLSGEYNGERYPSYARMDASLRRTYHAERFDWTVYIQVLNILNRTNTLRVDWAEYYANTKNGTIENPSLGDADSSLPILPSVGVALSF